MSTSAAIDRPSRTATIAVHGDLAIPDAKGLYDCLKSLSRRRDIRTIVLDLGKTERIDGAGIAVVSLGRKLARRSGKKLEIANGTHHARALELIAPPPRNTLDQHVESPATKFEIIGGHVLAFYEGVRASGKLFGDAFTQLGYVLAKKKKLPKGATSSFIVAMGIDALPIVCMLSALLGATLAFQGIVLLKRFGAGMFVADMTGLAMVREFAPMMTAIVLTGRNGAAIAAELGTMRVRGELDALDAMGISSSRFLLLPRLLALMFVQPALTLIGIFVGIIGAGAVARASLDLPLNIFWARVVGRVDLMDCFHGLGKSFLFALIIGVTGSYFGMRTTSDPSSVGAATTRTVVVGIFLIILVDAIAATLGSLGGPA